MTSREQGNDVIEEDDDVGEDRDVMTRGNDVMEENDDVTEEGDVTRVAVTSSMRTVT